MLTIGSLAVAVTCLYLWIKSLGQRRDYMTESWMRDNTYRTGKEQHK